MKISPTLAAIVLLVGLAIPCSAEQPCQAGSLANVLGTSCTVGPLTLNFGTFFQSGVSPAAIGFIPVVSGNQAGFTLVMNFVIDNSAPDLDFQYTPQAGPNVEIRAENLTMNATAQGAPQGAVVVQLVDFQNFPNAGFMDPVTTDIDIEAGNVKNFVLSSQVILPVPGFASIGFSGQPSTTDFFSFAEGGATASVTSATFLYTLGPIIPAPPDAALIYTNIDLPNTASTTVSNINNAGTIVGAFADTDGISHGYLSGRDGQVTVIDFPGATGTFGEGVNDRGDVTGFYNDAAGASHGFILERGNFVSVDFPGALDTEPIGINNRGQIVGGYVSADQGLHGFLFYNGQFTTIDQGPETGSSASTFAQGINDRGEITGTFFDPDTLRGFVGRNSLFIDFDVPGQGNTIPSAINSQGSIVGGYDDINLVQHGFVTIGDSFLSVDFPGSNDTFALGINARGQIVGSYADSGGNFHSFLAEPGFNGDKSGRSFVSSPRSTSKPVCGGDKWKEQVKRRRDPRCQVQH
jgi:probable HAF family extracellular repeat protein